MKQRERKRHAVGAVRLAGAVALGIGQVLAGSQEGPQQDYIVAAYVWPSCHDEPMSREALWSEGAGEWEIVKKAAPRFDGHCQPRVPLWGYKMDDDPLAWEQKIDAALSHGVNAFIFDGYWFDGKPFLEEAVNEGFLGASNTEKARFYLMWGYGYLQAVRDVMSGRFGK